MADSITIQEIQESVIISSSTNKVTVQEIPHTVTISVVAEPITAPTVIQQQTVVALQKTTQVLEIFQNPLSGSTSQQNFVYQEIPQGPINGINTLFTTTHAPNPAASLALYKNGIRQSVGNSYDYTLSGLTITFNTGAIPNGQDQLTADYTY